MHQLSTLGSRGRLVSAYAADLFDPDAVTSSPLPLVLIDRREGARFESDVRLMDDFDLLPTLLLFDIATTEAYGDPAFWDRMSALVFAREIDTWYNLAFQTEELQMPLEEVQSNMIDLYLSVGIDPDGDIFEWGFLNEVTREVLGEMIDASDEYVVTRYTDAVTEAMALLVDVFHLSCVWHMPPAGYPAGPEQGQAAYADVCDRNERLWAEAGTDETWAVERKNPYKGGGFTCIN